MRFDWSKSFEWLRRRCQHRLKRWPIKMGFRGVIWANVYGGLRWICRKVVPLHIGRCLWAHTRKIYRNSSASKKVATQPATRRWSNVGTWSAWLVERRSWHANVRPTLGQREQPNRWVDMVGPMLARRMIFDGEMCSRLANVGIWPLTNRRPRVVGPATVLGLTLTYSIVCRFDFFFINIHLFDIMF